MKTLLCRNMGRLGLLDLVIPVSKQRPRGNFALFTTGLEKGAHDAGAKVTRFDGFDHLIALVMPSRSTGLDGLHQRRFLDNGFSIFLHLENLNRINPISFDGIRVDTHRMIVNGRERTLRRVLKGQQYLGAVVRNFVDRLVRHQGGQHGVIMHRSDAVPS
jgi:hypothetical protein